MTAWGPSLAVFRQFFYQNRAKKYQFLACRCCQLLAHFLEGILTVYILTFKIEFWRHDHIDFCLMNPLVCSYFSWTPRSASKRPYKKFDSWYPQLQKVYWVAMSFEQWNRSKKHSNSSSLALHKLLNAKDPWRQWTLLYLP